MLIRPFHLTASQRKKDVSKFVDALLRGDMGEAKGRYQIVKNSGFKILLTRSLENAKDYCRNQYAGKRKKKFGRIASSGKIFLENKSNQRKDDIVKWYCDESCYYYCSKLYSVQDASKVQGLEFDVPILEWYEDLEWVNGKWKPSHVPEYFDKRTLYSYRVLLTRGRDGLIIYVPDRTELNDVYDVLRKVGLDDLDKGDY